MENFGYVLHQFGYEDLMTQFIKHQEQPETTKSKEAFMKALWDDIPYDSHPSDQYCEELMTIDWDWGNSL